MFGAASERVPVQLLPPGGAPCRRVRGRDSPADFRLDADGHGNYRFAFLGTGASTHVRVPFALGEWHPVRPKTATVARFLLLEVNC
jgi:hypothetical protein